MGKMPECLIAAVTEIISELTIDHYATLMRDLGVDHHTFIVRRTADRYNVESIKAAKGPSAKITPITFNGGPNSDRPYYGTVEMFVADRVLRQVSLFGLSAVAPILDRLMATTCAVADDEKSDEWDDVAALENSNYAG